mgnify:CR=1 FL=1
MINVQNLLFSYSKHDTFSLSIDNFEVKEKEHHFIYGPSGCGKTTFLNLLSGILTPQQGRLRLLNTDVSALSTMKRDQFRADHIGIIFQLFNLIEYLASENINWSGNVIAPNYLISAMLIYNYENKKKFLLLNNKKKTKQISLFTY